MMGNIWGGSAQEFLIILIIVDHASKSLAVFLVVFAAAGGILLPVYRGRYLPRFVMDILDRLTNKQSLENAYEAKEPKS